MKKILTISVFVISLVLLMSMSAAAISDLGYCGEDIMYTYNSVDESVLISGQGSMDNFPDCKLTPFYSSNIKAVEIESGVTTIGDYAFYGCENLSEIVIPQGVTYIGVNSFFSCDFSQITLPSSIKKIGFGAFEDCDNLNDIYFEGTAEAWQTIEIAADLSFATVHFICTHANKTQHPGQDATCTAEGYTAGVYCPDCETWLDGHEMIEAEHVDGDKDDFCDKCHVYIPMGAKSGTCGDDLTWEFDFDNRLLKISGTGEMFNCRADEFGEVVCRWSCYIPFIKTVEIASGVTSIGDYAFYKCEYLEKITISDSVTKIGESAFEGTAYYKNANNWSDGILYIDKCLIKANEGIDAAEIRPDTKCIAKKAFYKCNYLKNIIIPDSVIYVGDYAFCECVRLKSVHIGDGVISIGDNAFESCDNMAELYLGNSITTIGKSAFWSCALLKEVTFPDNLTYIGCDAFSRCSSLISVTIPDKVTYMGRFTECTNLKNVTIGDSVTDIESWAFAGCNSLTSIVIPDNVTMLYQNIFEDCHNLEFVTIGAGVTEIPYQAFLRCYNLKNITLGDNITTIRDRGFDSCGQLQYIVLPACVDYIDDKAFCGASEINHVLFKGNQEQFENIAFGRENDNIKNATWHINATGGEITERNFCDTTYDYCSVCQTTCVPVEDHSWRANTDNSTGCEDKVVVYTCDKCSTEKTEDIPGIGHDWYTNYDVTPSCVDKLVTYYCYNCSASKGETISGTGKHDWDTGDNTEPACYDREIWYYCDGCGSEKSETIKGTGHSLRASDSEEPSCEDREIRYICEYCYGADKYVTIKGTGHDMYTSLLIEATCVRDGVKYERCEKCNYYVVELLKATGKHNPETTVIPATETDAGHIVKKCTECSGVTDSTVIPKIASVKLSKTEYTYNGKVQTPSVTVKDSNGNTLKKNTDYTVKLESGRKLPGKYTVTITFKGKYAGTKKLTYTIAPQKVTGVSATQTATTITLKWSKVTGADAYRVYKYNSKTKKYEKLKDVTDTTLKITDLKAGASYKYKVRAITKDDGSIYGAYSSGLAIATKCKTPAISSIYSKEKGKAVVKWNNVAGESGYQLYYATSKDGEYKKVNSYAADKTTGSKTKLTSKKTYYFKVRAYKKTADGTVFSAWSAVKSVKIK